MEKMEVTMFSGTNIPREVVSSIGTMEPNWNLYIIKRTFFDVLLYIWFHSSFSIYRNWNHALFYTPYHLLADEGRVHILTKASPSSPMLPSIIKVGENLK